MSIRYHQHATLAAAEAHLKQLRAAGALAFVVTMNATHHEVVQLYAPSEPPSAIDAHIGSLVTATLEPMTATPATGHVTIDARDMRDVWENAR